MSAEVYADTDEYTVRWNDEADAVEIEWHRFVSGEPFRAGTETLLEFLRERGARRQLANSQEITTLDDDDQEWLMADWTPRAAEAGLEATAIVYPESVIAKMNVEQVENVASQGPVDHFFTTDVAEAIDWLDAQ